MSSGHRHERKLSTVELDDLLEEALDNPKIIHRLSEPYSIVINFDIPLLGSSSTDHKKVYLDRHLRHLDWPFGVLPMEGKRFDVKLPLVRHERLEQALEDELKWPYLPLAHPVAQHWEEQLVRKRGCDPRAYEKMLEPFIKYDEHEKLVKVPRDLDMRPLYAPPVSTKIIAHIKSLWGTKE